MDLSMVVRQEEEPRRASPWWSSRRGRKRRCRTSATATKDAASQDTITRSPALQLLDAMQVARSRWIHGRLWEGLGSRLLSSSCQSVLHAELLDALPKYIADGCLRHGYCAHNADGGLAPAYDSSSNLGPSIQMASRHASPAQLAH